MKKQHYEVWAVGYAGDDITDIDECLGEFEDEEKATEFAQQFNTKEDVEKRLEAAPEALVEVEYYNIIIEYCSDEDGRCSSCVYSAFTEETNKKTYKVEFLADLTEDDIRALNEYFNETLRENLYIEPFALKINKF